MLGVVVDACEGPAWDAGGPFVIVGGWFSGVAVSPNKDMRTTSLRNPILSTERSTIVTL